MCSAVSHETIVWEALEIGAVDFVAKPFPSDELGKIITKYLGPI